MEIILYWYGVQILDGFKSHYVVWKLICREKNTGSEGMFKSHYVVWKFQSSQKGHLENICLNRTM